MFQVQKPKSAAKTMIPPSVKLTETVLDTLREISEIVGATLGPAGRQVLIERPEIGMKPIVTKDGVTVMRHLGFEEGAKQLVLESVRDAAIRTATEAGDGTTSSSILSYAIAKATHEVCALHKTISPQMIVRQMVALFPDIENFIKKGAIEASDASTLLRVATLSANGDKGLSEAVMESLSVVGDEGNLSIIENIGPHGYKIQKIHGYTVEQGHETSMRNMAHSFVNDKTGTKVLLDAPIAILYDGVVNDLSQVWVGLTKIHEYIESKGVKRQDVLLVAHGFSDSVVGDLSLNWNHAQSKVKVVPLMTPESFIKHSRSEQLRDIQAYTGCSIFNPTDKPIADIDVEVLARNCLLTLVEIDRFKAMLFANEDIDSINCRVDEIKERLKTPESEYEKHECNLRIGKLTSGIARLEISAPSIGETREKRDRAEDAWMSVKGAIKHGAVAGGGYTLIKLRNFLSSKIDGAEKFDTQLALQILSKAMNAPVRVLYGNFGYSETEIDGMVEKLSEKNGVTYDVAQDEWVSIEELLDSVPAITEAIRNSLSIASLLGSLGGIICFKRDYESDKQEEKYARRYQDAVAE